MISRRSPIAAAALVLAAVPACAQDETPAPGDANDTSIAASTDGADAARAVGVDSVRYDLIGTGGETVGTVELRDGAGGVLLKVEVEGLEPGEHGLHIHETARCEPPFESAGGHYAPAGRSHGFLSSGGPHTGDLPNLVVAEGAARAAVQAWVAGVTVEQLTDGDGSALVIHAGADDYRTDPAGDSGDRIACAAIRDN